jgi:hypothetical protein
MAVNHIDCFTAANIPDYQLKEYAQSMANRSAILSLLHLAPSPAGLLRSHSHTTVRTEFPLKSSVCLDIMPWQPTFRRTCQIHLQVRKFTFCWFLARLILRIHDIISTKTEFTVNTQKPPIIQRFYFPMRYIVIIVYTSVSRQSLMEVHKNYRLQQSLTICSIKYYNYTGCFKKSFTTLKVYTNLFKGHVQCFELP